MAKFERGNMWNAFHETDAFCITTNSYIRNDGELVMGRGIAKVAKQLFDDLPSALGDQVEQYCGHLGVYGLMPSNRSEIDKIVAFQVKTHFKDKADLDLIRESSSCLQDVATEYPDKRFDLNFPGIGNGGRNESEVMPIIESLPENIHVWRFRNE